VSSSLERFDSDSDPSRSRGIATSIDLCALTAGPVSQVPVAWEAGCREAVSVRVAPDLAALSAADPDHHLWRNGRLWWVAFTVHRGHLQHRVRHSLGTADVAEARRRRDAVLSRYAEEPGCALSLRLAPVARRSANS
jgi:hypothetical protein